MAHTKDSGLDLKTMDESFKCSTQAHFDGSVKDKLERIMGDLGDGELL